LCPHPILRGVPCAGGGAGERLNGVEPFKDGRGNDRNGRVRIIILERFDLSIRCLRGIAGAPCAAGEYNVLKIAAPVVYNVPARNYQLTR